MKFLFDGKYAPLTNRIAFINSPIDNVLQAHEKWANGRIQPVPYKITVIKEEFESLLEISLPFIYPCKDIILQTTGCWTAYYHNQHTITYFAERVAGILDVDIIIAEALPSYYGKKVNGWGGGLFTLMRNDVQIRHLMLSDQDRWEFDNYGEPLAFEDIEKYKEKFARNRFTPEMLDKYLKEFDIDFFNESFYLPQNTKACVITEVRPPYENEITASLSKMRKSLRYD